MSEPVQQTLIASLKWYERVGLQIVITLWQSPAKVRCSISRGAAVDELCQLLVAHRADMVGIGLRCLKCPTFDHNFIRFSVVPAICNASIAKIKSHLS